MAKNTEQYQGTKARMTAAKGLVTRSINKLESACVELTRKQDDIPDRTKNRLAEEIIDNRQKVEKNLLSLEEVGAALIEVIATLDPKEAAEDLEKMVSKVDEDIETYAKKYEGLKKDHDMILETADNPSKNCNSSQSEWRKSSKHRELRIWKIFSGPRPETCFSR